MNEIFEVHRMIEIVISFQVPPKTRTFRDCVKLKKVLLVEV